MGMLSLRIDNRTYDFEAKYSVGEIVLLYEGDTNRESPVGRKAVQIFSIIINIEKPNPNFSQNKTTIEGFISFHYRTFDGKKFIDAYETDLASFDYPATKK